MQRLVGRVLPALAGLIVVVLFLGHLVSSDAVLVFRDVPIFHLPLRATFAELAQEGLPVWNNRIHGGQPVLSNPNYAAFYPPSWIVLALPTHTAISWLVVLHGVFGFAGAWMASRRFGCGSAAATLTAVAFLGGGAMLSAANGVAIFCSAAWLPWILYWSRGWFENPDERAVSLAGALPGFGLAMSVLAGEPAIALASSLAVGCLALTSPGRPLRRLRKLAIVAGFALLLSAIQVVPTAAHVANTARAATSASDASIWSTPPLRLLEFALPRLYGDPMGLDQDLYFGWKLHDRNFPYLISIYAGQLVLILALAAFLRWPIPARLFWITLAGAGLALAFGRFNPLYAGLAPKIPLLGLIRYPEKFLLLTTTAIAFGAGLGWQHVLENRGRKPAREDFAIALAAVIVGVVLVFCLTLTLRPEVAHWFIRHNTLLAPTGERLATAASFLGRESWIALGAGLASLGVLTLHRVRRTPSALLVPLTLVALVADLAYYNRRLTPTIDYQELSTPPAHVAGLDPGGGRVFTDEPFAGREGVVPRSARPGPDALWSKVDRAEPYVGNLWGYAYALHLDFDKMLTEPARRSLALIQRHESDIEATRRILAAWGVRYFLANRSVSELTMARLDGKQLAAVEVEVLPWRRPLLSWEPSVGWHLSIDEAEKAAAASGFAAAHWVGSPRRQIAAGGAPDKIERLEARSASTLLEYSSSSILYAVVNTTFDRGWRAHLDGERIAVNRTALGQIGLELPTGKHVLELRFLTPGLPLGASITLLTLLTLGAVEIVRRRQVRSPSQL